MALLALQNTPIQDFFNVELPTEPEALASVRTMLRRWLRHVDGTEQEIAEITTACGEAATNAIEHAGAEGHAVRGRGQARRQGGGDHRARLRAWRTRATATRAADSASCAP